MNKKLFAIAFGALAMFACKEPEPEEPVVPQEPELPEITLAAPEDGTVYDLNEMSEVLAFGWNENEEINSYRLQLSLTPDFEVMEILSAKNNPAEVGIAEMDEVLAKLGLPEAKSAYLYWRVAPLRSDDFVCEPFKIFINRLDPSLRVIAPVDGMRYNLDDQKSSIAFEWKPAVGAKNHVLKFSLSDKFDKFESVTLGAKDGRYSISATTLDGIAGKLGAEPDATCEIYWQVVPEGKDAAIEPYPARMITVERKYPYISVIAPEESYVIDLESTEKVTFSWEKSGVSKFFFDVALSKDFSDMERTDVGTKTTYELTAAAMETLLDKAGVNPGSNGVIYWRVSPQSGSVLASEPRVIVAKRVDNSVKLLSPANSANYSCNSCDEILFQWGAIEGIEAYDIEFSLDKSFATKEVYNLSDGLNDPTSEYVGVDYLDSMLQNLGVEAESTALVYWRIVPIGEHNKELEPRKLTIERKDPRFWIPYEERLADPITVKVAVIFEDPIMPGTNGKRMHEVCRIGQSYGWNDPEVQLNEYIESMKEASHGLVDYEIVMKVHTDDPEVLAKYNNKIFYSTSAKDHFGKKKGEFIDIDFVKGYCQKGTPDGVCEYDYVTLVTDFGLDAMRRANEVQDVWVYTHPGCGMNESRLIGKDAFWCNSGGINRPDLCDDFITVMFHNYERTTDLAIHSFGHRFESMMSAVYGGFDQFYKGYYKESQLNNWMRYCGYLNNYGSGYFPEETGYAQIGYCHFPPNGDYDYDYGNKRYCYTYADEWYNYPRLTHNKRTARKVNITEWDTHPTGSDQWGFMIWYHHHMPHFKGLNPADGYLNNWWLYCYDYKNARKLEAQLREEMGWTEK